MSRHRTRWRYSAACIACLIVRTRRGSAGARTAWPSRGMKSHTAQQHVHAAAHVSNLQRPIISSLQAAVSKRFRFRFHLSSLTARHLPQASSPPYACRCAYANLEDGTTSYETGETWAQDRLAYGLQVSGCWQHGTVLRIPAAYIGHDIECGEIDPTSYIRGQRIYVFTPDI